MDKELKLIYTAVKFGKPDEIDFSKFSSFVRKLFNEEMLRLIGDDKDDVVYGQDMSFDRGLNNGKVYGYNQAKQELRNAINTEGEQ
jgi:hypothetical protein